MKNIKFIGHIETISPVSVSLPNHTSMPKNTHGAYYIPSGSIRGMLRSMSTYSICKILKDKLNVELPVDVIYMLQNGADTGRELKLGGGYETLAKNLPIRLANPHISNFGNFATAGKVKMGNAYCDPNINPITQYGNGSRNHPFNRNPDLLNFVKPSEIDYLKDIMQADALTSMETAEYKQQEAKLKSSLRTADNDEKKAIFSQLEEIEATIKAIRSKRAGSSETILFALPGFDAIDLGHTLSHRFTITNASELELNYLLWVFYKASSFFRVGGHQNIGCGEISAHWTITETSLDNPTPKKLGELIMNDDGFQLTGINFDPVAIEDAIISGTFDFTAY